jgi:hypothetical protein
MCLSLASYFTATTSTRFTSTQQVSNKFVINSNISPWDWTTNWDVTEPWATDATYIGGINNPCPNGFRIPTYAELEAERPFLNALSSPLINSLASSFLKIPGAGYWHQSANGERPGTSFGLWSSTVSSNGTQGQVMRFFDGGSINWGGGSKGDGYSCRCIKN